MITNEESKVFFSVIIPTYNRASTVERALNSVLQQTYSNFEVIVVDDFSTDSTAQVIGKYNDPKIIYTLNAHKKGACGARNTGADMAKGKWLAFLDSDDYWKPEKLAEVAKEINQSDFQAFYSAYEWYSLDGKDLHFKRKGHSGFHLDELYYKNTIGGLSVFIVSKTAFDAIGGFDENFRSKQDTDLYIRLAKKYMFGFIDRSLVNLNHQQSNRISFNSKSRIMGWISFYDKYKTELSFSGRYYHCKRILAIAVTDLHFFLILKFSWFSLMFGFLSFFEKSKRS